MTFAKLLIFIDISCFQKEHVNFMETSLSQTRRDSAVQVLVHTSLWALQDTKILKVRVVIDTTLFQKV